MDKEVILKKGKETPILNKHHWIFSGAIASVPDNVTNGDIFPVLTSKREMLGYAYFNKGTDISGRMISFGKQKPEEALKQNLERAVAYRKLMFDDNITNAYRVINSEGDGIPGLTVDKYADVLVIQVSTVGIEKLKDLIVQNLIKLLKPKCIYEKSNMPARKREGLELFEDYIYGEKIQKVEIIENNVKFVIDLKYSHKTGFYLDQREMRVLIGQLSKGKNVLNCFSYTGGFSLYAALNGAKRVDSVDISEEVIKQAEENFKVNGLSTEGHGFYSEDVFKFLRERPINYDLIILDPPAFAKKRADVNNAIRGYRDINRLALSRMPRGSFLLTCSCSHHVDEDMFKKIVTQAATYSNKNIRIIQSHHLGYDHPINIFHPEVNYLKSLLLYID